MIRPFGLHDVLLLRRLQRSCVSLAIENILTHPRDPLWIALTAPWPWAGLGVATYVLEQWTPTKRAAGFIQLMKRTTRPEADVLYLAPALQDEGGPDPVSADIWRTLLVHCGSAAAGHGVQRIFASIPDEGLAADCLKDAGFSLYVREIIFRLDAVPLLHGMSPGFRRQLPQDSWALQRLYTRSTPRLVQQAEGAVSGEVGSPPLSWWEPNRWQGVVWDPAGEARGAVQVHLGRAGHWLRVWGANLLTPRELRELIEQGLRTIVAAGGGYRSLPVYATVRDYESGLSGALTGFGFAPYAERARFVRHTVGTARRPTRVSSAAGREIQQEIAVRIVRDSRHPPFPPSCGGREVKAHVH